MSKTTRDTRTDAQCVEWAKGIILEELEDCLAGGVDAWVELRKKQGRYEPHLVHQGDVREIGYVASPTFPDMPALRFWIYRGRRAMKGHELDAIYILSKQKRFELMLSGACEIEAIVNEKPYAKETPKS